MVSFYEINGAGRDKRDAIKEMVGACTKGRSILTNYEKRAKDETIVSGWKFMRSHIKLGVFAN
ncbi:MAG TPA: hypothetical protein VFI73_00950 [Candidatus Nitrosopolaris sp.]|nr:hypothetical protein [Candidatus Nitrosopolaris sp.]